ncbi:MAG: sulfite exporter TauE/SafE family protein [Dehalococcoidia bacterium]|nr:sulfite exporter TauE/SafE family protein [Dehalococcoidia bacterium]
MAESVALIVLGLAAGTFGTLVGSGGGFILVPVLLLAYPGREASTITAMSLLVVFANAASGAAAYGWQRRIDLRSGGWFALATLPGAVAGALLVHLLPRRGFDALFAAVLGLAGAYLLARRRSALIREPLAGRGVVTRTMRDREGYSYVYRYRLWQGMVLSTGVGFLSSLLGIGGGIVHVPIMVLVLRFPVHIAVATSQFVLALTALQGTAVHLASGSLAHGGAAPDAALLALGVVPGAQLGARLAARLRGETIVRVLAVALLLAAARLALAGVLG